MTPERWEKIGEIYHAALELKPEEREVFLDLACGGDDVLRDEVQSLISADEKAGDFIAGPALPAFLEDAAQNLTGGHYPDIVDQGRIGRYEVKSLLGSGGMGKVYLAKDTRLGRLVALKLLSPGAYDNQTAKRRMMREARSVAALNHPNIVTIYSIEETEGLIFIVMEYIPGETLTAQIRKHKFGFKRLLDVGAQVAGALAVAHSAGLIHRDIKPSNIIITTQKQAKLLDFGIVKITRPMLGEGGSVDSRLTAEGDVIGTVAYMSPEQVRGAMLDFRTDIFSLGSMLYEAATGKLPFTGVNSFSIAHEIMTTEPAPPSSINRNLPPEFDEIIDRCLAKDKEQRYQSASELGQALTKLKIEVSEGRALRNQTQPRSDSDDGALGAAAFDNLQTIEQRIEVDTARTGSVITLQRKTVVGIVAGVLIALAGLAFAFYKLLAPIHFGIDYDVTSGVVETRLTNTGNIGPGRPSISPNGKYIAYVVQDSQQTSSLWIRQLGAFSGVRVIKPANVNYLGVTFSLDGNHLYYGMREENSQLASLYRIPLLGGAVQKILADLDSPISFSPDGNRFVFRRHLRESNERALFVANIDGSGETKIATAKSPDFYGDPAWSPDGNVIVCSSGHADGGVNRYLVEVSVGDWKMRQLSSRKWQWVGPVEWLSDGKGLLMIASESPAEPYRVWRLSYPNGEARRVTNNAVSFARLSLSADSSALLVSQLKRNTHLWLIPRDEPHGARKLTFGAGGFRSYVNWTPLGKIVFDSETAGIPDISIIEEDGSNQRQLFGDMRGKATAVSSAVTPDGRYLIFGFDQTGIRHVWRSDLKGGNLVQLTNGGGEDQPHCSPDGKWVVYTDISSSKPTLWKISIDGGEPVQLTTAASRYPIVSPDGKLIACLYTDEKSNRRSRLGLIPFDGGEPFRIFPQTLYTGFPAKWTPDGRALTYTDANQANIWLQRVEGGEPKRLTDFSSDLIFGYDWSPDGKRLACVRGIWERDLILLRNIR